MAVQAELILCRCEGVTESAVRAAIQTLGASSVNEVKKLTRAGMGICQGRTCACLVQMALAQAGAPGATMPFTPRPPVRPVPLPVLARCATHFAQAGGPLTAAQVWGETLETES